MIPAVPVERPGCPASGRKPSFKLRWLGGRDTAIAAAQAADSSTLTKLLPGALPPCTVLPSVAPGSRSGWLVLPASQKTAPCPGRRSPALPAPHGPEADRRPGAGMRPQRNGGRATFPLTGNLEDRGDGGAIPAWSASASTGPAHQPGAHVLVAELSAMLRTLPLRLITSILALVAGRQRALPGARPAHRRRPKGRAAHAVSHGTRLSGRRDQGQTEALGGTITLTRTAVSLDKVASAA
jgi:hypothetical protein